MPAPVSPAGKLVCESCGSKLPYDARLAGKKCRCGKCGHVLLVPPVPMETDVPLPPAPEHASPLVQFHCVACQRHLKAKSEHAGKKAKCPQCGAMTTVPVSATHVTQATPSISTGDEYDLWGVDEAPSPADLLARQPVMIPVYCLNCDTLMYAQAEQVGQKIECPDCGARTPVKVPPVVKKRPSVLSPDGEEYQVEPAAEGPQKPLPSYVKRLEEQSRKEVEEARKQREDEAPPMPRFPTLQGVLPMMFCWPVVNWWAGISGVGIFTLLVLAAISSVASGGFGAIVIVCWLAFLVIMCAMLFCATAAIGGAMITDSSDGLRRLYNPPNTNFSDWAGMAVYFAIALAISPVPGSLLIQVTGAPHELVYLSFVVFFPILLLSMLEQGSPLAIFSPKILDTLVRRFHYWLLLILQSYALLAVTAVLLVGADATGSTIVLLVVSPIGLWLLLLYFRILGRFAWWLSE